MVTKPFHCLLVGENMYFVYHLESFPRRFAHSEEFPAVFSQVEKGYQM